MPTNYVVSMDTKEDGLEVVGGKGRSLARMTNAGLNVPGGFQVTTAAYREFVAENNLQEKIIELAKPAVVNGFASFETASQNVQALFQSHSMSQDIVDEAIAINVPQITPFAALREQRGGSLDVH